MTNPPRIDYVELPSATAHELTRGFYAKAFGWQFTDYGPDYAATTGGDVDIGLNGLLWSLVLAGWTLAVTAASSSLDAPFRSRVLGFLGLISIGFQLFMLATSNPFARLMPAATEGLDLNPLLQDFALAVHPPILYFGYVGFSVAFAFACATLLEGRLDAAWARWTRPWTLAAWLFLTIGIALGRWWA